VPRLTRRVTKWDSNSSHSAEAGSRAELEEHVRDEHSAFSWLLEPMLERCGFRIEIADYSADGIFAQYLLRRVR